MALPAWLQHNLDTEANLTVAQRRYIVILTAELDYRWIPVFESCEHAVKYASDFNDLRSDDGEWAIVKPVDLNSPDGWRRDTDALVRMEYDPKTDQFIRL